MGTALMVGASRPAPQYDAPVDGSWGWVVVAASHLRLAKSRLYRPHPCGAMSTPRRAPRETRRRAFCLLSGAILPLDGDGHAVLQLKAKALAAMRLTSAIDRDARD